MFLLATVTANESVTDVVNEFLSFSLFCGCQKELVDQNRSGLFP